MADVIHFEDYDNLICKLVRHWAPMIPKGGVKDSEEYAECCVAFCHCRDYFDPAMGNKFTTLLGCAMYRAVNHIFDQRRKRAEICVQNESAMRQAESRPDRPCAAEELSLVARLPRCERMAIEMWMDRMPSVVQQKRLGICRSRVKQLRQQGIQRIQKATQ